VVGLREKQKAARRELIERAASELFVEKGFADTTIEAIAERAVVSAPTVYNYYGTKGDLLLALVARGEESIEGAQHDFSKQVSQNSPVQLVSKVILFNVQGTLSALSRELWGHVVAFVATAQDPEVAPRYLETISSGLAGVIEAVLVEYQKDGRLKERVDVHALSYLLTRMERIHFLNFLYLKHMSEEELQTAIKDDVAIIVGAYENNFE